MSRIKLFIPLIVLAVLVAMFMFVLTDEDRDPNLLPSVLVGRDFPQFSLPDLLDGQYYSREDIVGEPFLLNVWATWCPSCRFEHAYLLKLANEGINVYGVDYKDDKEKALQWISELGNPYKLNFFDPQGELVVDLGVYGAPETYVVNAEGKIIYRHVGVVNEKVWQETLKSLYFSGEASTTSPQVQTSSE